MTSIVPLTPTLASLRFTFSTFSGARAFFMT